MAGDSGRITVPEHAGQVPVVREHHTQEQRHHTLRYFQRTKTLKTGTNSQVPQRHNRTELPQDKDSRFEV